MTSFESRSEATDVRKKQEKEKEKEKHKEKEKENEKEKNKETSEALVEIYCKYFQFVYENVSSVYGLFKHVVLANGYGTSRSGQMPQPLHAQARMTIFHFGILKIFSRMRSEGFPF